MYFHVQTQFVLLFMDFLVIYPIYPHYNIPFMHFATRYPHDNILFMDFPVSHSISYLHYKIVFVKFPHTYIYIYIRIMYIYIYTHIYIYVQCINMNVCVYIYIHLYIIYLSPRDNISPDIPWCHHFGIVRSWRQRSWAWGSCRNVRPFVTFLVIDDIRGICVGYKYIYIHMYVNVN